jgi:hypothetical protein
MKVLTISGSLRQNSWNRKLLRLASEVLKRQGAEVEEFDLTPLPIYNGDVEAKGLPDTTIPLRNAIKNADAGDRPWEKRGQGDVRAPVFRNPDGRGLGGSQPQGVAARRRPDNLARRGTAGQFSRWAA